MAPTSGGAIEGFENSGSSTEISLPVDLEDYPYYLQTHVFCLNTLHAVATSYEDCISQIEELENSIEPFINQPIEDSPSDLEKEYRRQYESVQEAGDDLVENVQELSEIDNRHLSQKRLEIHSSTLDEMNNDTELIAAYLEQIDHIFTETPTNQGDLEGLYSQKKELIVSLEDTEDQLEEFTQVLSRKVNQEVNKIEHLSGNTIFKFRECPLCGEGTNCENVGHLFRCHNCKAELAGTRAKSGRYELLHADPEWTGWVHEVTGKHHWDAIGDTGPDIDKGVVTDHYQKTVEKLQRVRKISIGIFVFGVFIAFLLNSLVGVSVLFGVIAASITLGHEYYTLQNVDLRDHAQQSNPQ